MLKGDFFEVLSVSGEDYRIRINASHPIFSGHFPSYPITPGVCLMQVAAELCGRTIAGAKDVKFLVPVLPQQTPELTFRISGPAVTVFDGETVYAKMKLEFS